jgi:UDPglucose 6-dehydrogenase
MRIAMVGSGYVGLASGACFAQFGHDVICIDKVADKVTQLRKGDAGQAGPDVSLDTSRGRHGKRLPEAYGAPALAGRDRWATSRSVQWECLRSGRGTPKR